VCVRVCVEVRVLLPQILRRL